MPLLLTLATTLFTPCSRAQLAIKGQERFITNTTTTVYIASNVPLSPTFNSTGINTFTMNVVPPTNSVRLYITNRTANACASGLVVTMASSGNGNVQSFNNNPFAFQTVLVGVGSSFQTTAPVNLPASGTVAVTSTNIIGNVITIFIVQSTGTCTTTNVDIQAVFGNFSSINEVQGIVAPGTTGTGVNPVLCGGIDPSGNAQLCGVYASSVSSGQSPTNGMAIGAPNQNPTASGIVVTMPNGNGGPLAVLPYAEAGFQGTVVSLVKELDAPYTASTNCSTLGTACSGLYVADAGLASIINMPSPIIGNQTAVWMTTGNGTIVGVESCRFGINGTNPTTGTGTATVDFYIQDSDDDTNWTDRIHFPTQTFGTVATAFHFWASFSGHITPETITGSTVTVGAINTVASASLAANSVIEGKPGKFLRFLEASSATWSCTTCTASMYCK